VLEIGVRVPREFGGDVFFWRRRHSSVTVLRAFHRGLCTLDGMFGSAGSRSFFWRESEVWHRLCTSKERFAVLSPAVEWLFLSGHSCLL
jgi:hypothetical protein